MKRNLMLKLVLTLVFIVPLWGSEIDLDYATFLGNEDLGVLEVYLNVSRDLFEFVENDQGVYESNIFFRVALVKNDSIVAIDEWSIKDNKFSKDADLGNQKIPEISILQATPGDYTLAAYAFDLNTKEKFSKTREVTIPDYATGDDLMISGIQMGIQMGKTEQKNKFSKYFGYDILPNASMIFTDGRFKIYPFSEVYNLKYDESDDNTYEIKYSVYGTNGQLVKTLKESLKPKPGESAVEVVQQGLDVSDIGTGGYVLVVEVADIQSQKTVSSQKRFYIIQQSEGDYLTADEDYNAGIEELSEEELDKIWGPMTYLASNLEKKQYKKSDLTGKRTLIQNFWKSRDPNPDTEANEAKILFYRRVRTAEQTYQSGFRKGWKSDRGRVLIKYGEPSEIERHPSAINTKPYEVWYYNEMEGGVQFIFLDKTGFGDMELVHSTARNELQNHDWQRMLK